MVATITGKDQLQDLTARSKAESYLILDFVKLPPEVEISTLVGISLFPLSGPDVI